MKTVVIGVLIALVLVEGYFLMMKKPAPAALGVTTQTAQRPSGAQTGRPLAPLAKGDKFAGSALEKFAHVIFPTMADAAKTVLTGFDVKTIKLADGSTQVDLVPKDSSDQFQSYVLKPGNSLYFIEMTPVDDKQDADTDANYRDDYGIITDANGLIQ